VPSIDGIVSAVAGGGGAKGNTGISRRQRMLIKVGIWLLLGLFAYRAMWTYWLAGVGIPDVEIDKVTGQKRIRRRPEQIRKYDPSLGKHVPT